MQITVKLAELLLVHYRASCHYCSNEILHSNKISMQAYAQNLVILVVRFLLEQITGSPSD